MYGPEVTDFPDYATLPEHSKFGVGTTEKPFVNRRVIVEELIQLFSEIKER